MLAATLFFDTSKESQMRAMYYMTKTFCFLLNFSFTFQTVIEIGFMYDLAKTIRQPFSNGTQRLIVIPVLGVVIALYSTIVLMKSDYTLTYWANLFNFWTLKIWYLVTAVVAIANFCK